MVLLINTADGENIEIALAKAGKIIKRKNIKAKYRQAEKLLPAFDDLLKELRTNLTKIKGIAVVAGPGSFSALRVGISLANTLGWTLNLPVLGVKLDEFGNFEELAEVAAKKIKKVKVGSIVEPYYGKEPNITTKNSNNQIANNK